MPLVQRSYLIMKGNYNISTHEVKVIRDIYSLLGWDLGCPSYPVN